MDGMDLMDEMDAVMIDWVLVLFIKKLFYLHLATFTYIWLPWFL